jgi:hypothetical protein
MPASTDTGPAASGGCRTWDRLARAGEPGRVALRDLRVRTGWRAGVATDSRPVLLSYTEFRFDTVRDLPRIYLAARRLGALAADLEGAAGLTVYWQPLRGRVGSLSAWTGRDALQGFVALSEHVEVMRRYRGRGEVRSATWWTDAMDVHASLNRGQRAVDG